MGWLGLTWFLVNWRLKRRFVEYNGKQGGATVEGWARRGKPTDPSKELPRGAEEEKGK